MSALEHVLGDHQAIPPDRGVFLATTRRLHPAICDFTSEPFDEGKLRPLEGLEHQAIAPSAAPLAAPAGAVAAADPLGAADQLAGSGLRWIPVEHIGRSNASPEEVDVVVSVFRDLLGRQWVDAAEKAHPTDAAATWRYVG